MMTVRSVKIASYSGGDIEAFVWACGAPWLGVFEAGPTRKASFAYHLNGSASNRSWYISE